MLNNATENNTENMVDDDVTVTNDETSFANLAGESLTSLVEIVPFARDQFGRQSMSEKRHATLDAKSTDTYQKRKKAREVCNFIKKRHFSRNVSFPGSWKTRTGFSQPRVHTVMGKDECP